MDSNNSIKFLSSSIKISKQSEDIEPLEIRLDSDDAEEKLSYFYSFINNIIDMDNLVILAGSGTSLTFNRRGFRIAPSMWNLWEDCKKEDRELFRLVIDATKYEMIQKDKEEDGTAKPNIELLLSLCDSSLLIGNLSDRRTSQVQRFLTLAKKVILEKTDFIDKVSTQNWLVHDKFIRSFGRRNTKQQRLKLFTTNYDLAFEQAASNTGFVVIDGFEFSNPSFFNPMWFNYDIVNRRHSDSSEGAYIPNVINLYKMHGSVDWRRVKGRVRKLGIDSLKGEPVFIYPSSKKYQTSYDSPYLDMMSSFLDVVKRPRTAVLCIGFGFNDNHINSAITMALRTNPEFMLMVATKSPFEVRGTFNPEIRQILTEAISYGDGRIAIVDSTFKQFVNLLPERRTPSPEEELFKVFEKISAQLK